VPVTSSGGRMNTSIGTFQYQAPEVVGACMYQAPEVVDLYGTPGRWLFCAVEYDSNRLVRFSTILIIWSKDAGSLGGGREFRFSRGILYPVFSLALLLSPQSGCDVAR
jgi:hypothetical protein